jgi:hypothetical protein
MSCYWLALISVLFADLYSARQALTHDFLYVFSPLQCAVITLSHLMLTN